MQLPSPVLSTYLRHFLLICFAVIPSECASLRSASSTDVSGPKSGGLSDSSSGTRSPPDSGSELLVANETRISSSKVFTLYNHNTREVIDFILGSGNATADTQHALDGRGTLEINLDETRDELLKLLESETTVVLDPASNEKIRTVSEDKLRTALDAILQRQILDARRSLDQTSKLTTSRASSNTEKPPPPSGEDTTFSSQLICQFFVFGTLFGVVCSISTCTCCLQPRADRRRNHDFNGVNPTNVPAPIDYSKPYMLKCDSRGSCYASPLSDDEVPPLPSYCDALSCSTQPAPTTPQHTPPGEVQIV